ncbi:elongator complex protein 3 [Pelolinea submarina]|uniref:tRNA carboxymethyluridine synthase n=1 Tax=Pelolinea submarina TaxID=913107 RepID=A0A347ZPU9_9CHLR|nr:tRNA uridine(34) 5-carboxymethylaminomethyl modification radical SAM/GNAT enzyme Elp3 [Pelolinea submarina]REG04655.1 elongator complex protein 3 [Pelolinea submarina]BBB47330.1 elongator complex protein 3 [Pelolinea submarina]
MDKKSWRNARDYSEEQLQIAGTVLDEIQNGAPVMKSVRSHPLSTGGYVAKHTLVYVYHQRVNSGAQKENPDLLTRIRMKPIRSLSGVSTVTVLTEPHECPGECLFCPDDQDLPKSYLREEPGAARAFQNDFDPFLQVQSRLESYQAIGHPIDKIELLILGGSWSAYDESYREWFVKRCLDAMNGSDSDTLEEAQIRNQSTASRNVGLVVETRPDTITPRELAHMRRLGVTKVQMGAQSFDDAILKLNCRGHGVKETLDACALLRAAGFKIVLHWMPNLMGASPDSDREDFGKMWSGGFCPDEIKIYPTQLLREAPLFRYWQEGKYQPYTTQQLINLLADIKPSIPIYTRVNRVIRDIPANYIQAGSLRSSLRQDVKKELEQRGQRCRCIRCREIRGNTVEADQLILDDFVYHPADAEEHFISYTTADDRLAGYLRLSLPSREPSSRAEMRAELNREMPELQAAGLIREVHIYGQSLEVGSEKAGAAQHSGLGTHLLEEAERIAASRGFQKLAVIAAIGTSLYYQKRGFRKEHLYMTKPIAQPSEG